MLTFDTSALPETPVMVVAQASTSSATTRGRVLGICVPVGYVAPGEQQHGGEGVFTPTVRAVSYFKRYESLVITESEYPDTVRDVQVVRQPAHGSVAYETNSGEKEGFWRYTPQPGYEGQDRFDLVVQVKGQSVQLVYFFQVTKKNIDTTPGEEFCKLTLWKISQAAPDSGSAGLLAWQRSADLSAFLANTSESVIGLAYLAESSIAQTSGEGVSAQIILDTAAGHGWYIDPTPLDNTDDYLPTSNPSVRQAAGNCY